MSLSHAVQGMIEASVGETSERGIGSIDTSSVQRVEDRVGAATTCRSTVPYLTKEVQWVIDRESTATSGKFPIPYLTN